MKFVPNALIKFIDSFLDSKSLASAEAKMRARMAALFFLFHFYLGITILLSGPFQSGVDYFRASYLFLICTICLVLIKRGVSPDKLLLPYLANLCLTALFTLWRFGSANSLDIISLFMFEMIVSIACLIIVDSRIRLSIVFLVTVCCFLSFWHYASNLGDIVFPSADLMRGIHFKMTVNLAFLLILLAMNLRIRKISQFEVDQELEWQMRNAKLEVLTSTMKSMIQLFSGPMVNFQKNLQELSIGHSAPLENKLQRDIDELLVISQSVRWIFRAHRSEEPSSILSSTLLDQLEVLLSPQCQKRGWILNTTHDGKPVQIWGPIPSIMLFLFTVVVQILEDASGSENRSLFLELKVREGPIVLKLKWKSREFQSVATYPLVLDSERSSSDVRQELIKELTELCGANIQGFLSDGIQQMMIRIPWRARAHA